MFDTKSHTHCYRPWMVTEMQSHGRLACVWLHDVTFLAQIDHLHGSWSPRYVSRCSEAVSFSMKRGCRYII